MLVKQQRSFAIVFCPEMTKSTAKSFAEKKSACCSAITHADLSFSIRRPLEKRSAKRAKTESGNGDDWIYASRRISGRGHMAESAGPRLKRGSPSHVVAGGAYKSREGSPHPFSLHAADSY